MLELRDQSRVRQWFLCLVALCYIAAFSSLYVQWPGELSHSNQKLRFPIIFYLVLY